MANFGINYKENVKMKEIATISDVIGYHKFISLSTLSKTYGYDRGRIGFIAYNNNEIKLTEAIQKEFRITLAQGVPESIKKIAYEFLNSD